MEQLSHRRRTRTKGQAWAHTLVCLAGLCFSPHLASADSRPGIVLIGSSSFNQAFGRLIASELEKGGYNVTRKGVSSSGLARPDVEDMTRLVGSMPITSSTSAVLVYLGVNDGQALRLQPEEMRELNTDWIAWNDPRWSKVYQARARAFLESICRKGARNAIVLLPVDVKLPRLQQRLARVREVLAEAAQQTTCATAISTSGDLGRFEAGGIATRQPDGVHMSMEGAQRVWYRIRPRVTQLMSGATSRIAGSGR